ncbi:5555_t:CDS:1, partial [Dentiscutata erythropus]
MNNILIIILAFVISSVSATDRWLVGIPPDQIVNQSSFAERAVIFYCPTGYSECSNSYACCPTGTTCLSDNKCDVLCSLADINCGSGCCEIGQTCGDDNLCHKSTIYSGSSSSSTYSSSNSSKKNNTSNGEINGKDNDNSTKSNGNSTTIKSNSPTTNGNNTNITNS